tara:strand:- start:166 stop:297 length:132 start_codon:yes stop_codon:yes gene_type:complete
MKRRFFLFSMAAFFFLPKSLFTNEKPNVDLVLKNGWLLKKEDF